MTFSPFLMKTIFGFKTIILTHIFEYIWTMKLQVSTNL